MTSHVQKLIDNKKVTAPHYLRNNIHYEVLMGSVAYGVSNVESDMDVYGFCIPPKNVIFPHLTGSIPGFGSQPEIFNQFIQHHAEFNSKMYDICIYNIVRYFQLVMENNPNMLDSLFVPARCVLYSSQLGQHVRSNRHLFLHKGSYHKFKGYAFSQLHKIHTKRNASNEKRQESINDFGYDVKFAYHVVRLVNEVEQILTEHTLDLERSKEQLKAIRNGEYTLDQVISYFNMKEKTLESAYDNSTLPHKPDESAIKNLLLECLEMHYGALDNVIKIDKENQLLSELQNLVARYSS